MLLGLALNDQVSVKPFYKIFTLPKLHLKFQSQRTFLKWV